jgi:hypothetical protein
MAIAAGLGLGNKSNLRSVRPRRLRITGFIARPDDHGDFLDTGRQRLFD